MSEIEELRTLTENEIYHKYMEYYIGKPRINTEKLYVLYSIMQNVPLPEMKKKRIIVTASLVQLALDTHDLVPEDHKAEADQDRIYTQLSVLAGDYYSGLYYQLLAEIGEIGLISVLSTAIRKINEAKMKLHYNDFSSEKELITILKEINGTLYVHLSDYIGPERIAGFLKEWLFFLFLSEEQKQYLPLFEKIAENNKHLHLDTKAIRRKSFEEVVESAKQLPAPYQDLQMHARTLLNNR
ncbi:heptaprenyl diphosphate synthase component 1 [Virgibacillus halophilus]